MSTLNSLKVSKNKLNKVISLKHQKFFPQEIVPHLSEILVTHGKTSSKIKKKRNSSYENYISMFSKKFKKVFVVAGKKIFELKKGNHEFYGNEYHSTKKQMKNVLSKYENVTFMDKTSEKYNGIRYKFLFF
jgi:hypothetical protein